MKTKTLNARRRKQWAVIAPLLVLSSACGSSEAEMRANVGTVPGSSVLATSSCVPITQQIPFTMTGAQISQRHIVAGQIPSQTAYGSIMTGGVATSGGIFYGQSAYGSLQVNLQLAQQQTATTGMTSGFSTGVANPYGVDLLTSQTTSGTGLLFLNTQTQDLIRQMVATGYIQIPGLSGSSTMTSGTQSTMGFTGMSGYPTTGSTSSVSASQICVSGIAMEFDISDNLGGMYRLFNGNMYLYLNNSTRGASIEF